VTLKDTEITTGESVQTALQVENTAEQDGTFQAALAVNSETVDRKSVAVEAGESKTVVFEHRLDEPGEYDIAVADTSLGTLTVTAASDDRTVTARPDDDAGGTGPIEVTDVTAPADWIKRGYETTVRATVVNTANRTANRTLMVTVDGQLVATETVTLGPNERDVVAIEFEAVSGTVTVEGVEAGRISVSTGSGDVRTETDVTKEDAGPGFGFGIAALVVVVAVIASVARLSGEGNGT
jgi:hypothetical protein